jgi:hypothetical protein
MQLFNVEWYARMFASLQLERSWEEAVKAYLKVLSNDSVGQTEKN